MAMNLLSGLQYVQQQGEAGRQRGLEDRFNRLAGEAFNAPDNATRDAAVGQVAVNNPRAAFGLKAQFQADEDRQTKLLVNGARYMKGALDSKNPNAVAGAWRTVRPSLIRAGLATEQELSPEWDPSYEQTVHQVLAMGDPNASGSVLQSQKIGADGYIYNSFRDGRMVNTGVKADRQAWFRDQPGIPAGIVDKNGVFTPLGESGGTPSGAFYEDGQPVATTTAIDASGAPVNIGNDIPADARAAILAGNANGVQSNGFMPINRVAGAGAGTTGTATRPSAAQDAAAKKRAELGAINENFENEIDQQRRLKEQEARIEAEKTAAVEKAKAEQERASNERAKTAQLNNVDRGLSRIDAALKGLTGKFVDTGPIDGRLMIATPEGQELEAAVGAIQNDMLALTRVPGIGSQSDLEAKIANLKYPSIYNHPSVNAANVQQLRAFMTDLRRQITGQGGTQQAPSAGRTVVRTGTSNGRRVIQYSDGSIEYGN